MGDRTDIVKRDRFPLLQLRSRQQTTSTSFTGLLGLWAWPLVNLILALAESKRAQAPAPVVLEQRRRMSLWDITRDKEGRIISILEKAVDET
jgi:hypothetical protein